MLPANFLQSIQEANGLNIESFKAVHELAEQVTSIRINPKKIVQPQHPNFNFPSSTPVPWCKYGYYLQERPSFTLDPNFHAGTYYVQEASSMFLWHMLQHIYGSDTSKKVLDVCAAPGGKSTLLSSFFTDGLVISNEVIKARAAVLVENITKWGADNLVVTNNDPKDFAVLENFFDAIVIDAPCSGSGMFRKDTTAALEWSLNNVALCSQRQQRIIADVFGSLKENGTLIYSTCSYSVEENEVILDWIMDNFSVETISIPIEHKWGIVATNSNKHTAFGYRFYPDKVKGEGFFIAAFKKTGATLEPRLKEQAIASPTKSDLLVVENFMQMPISTQLFKHNTQIRAIPINWMKDLKLLANYLYIKKAGICLGEVKGKDFVPNHELAVSSISLSNIATIELTKEQALQYLRRKEFLIDYDQKGWVLAKYDGVGIGWLKVLPNRLNNYYPQEWRILKE